MTNVLLIGIVGAFIILIIAAYIQSRKTRQELIDEMKEEILSNEPAPVAKPAPVVAVKDIPALVVALAAKAKAAVQEMVTTQEAPIVKPKAKRKRPAKKKPAQS